MSAVEYARACRLLENLVDTVEAAIAAGDWKVDGAADPGPLIDAAQKYKGVPMPGKYDERDE